MLNLDKLAATPPAARPFRHLAADGVLAVEDQPALAHDFPDQKKTGFFPVEQLDYGPAFAKLLAELQAPEFSRILGEKLDRELIHRPKMIVVRRRSAARDGRAHTDGADKVATALFYLNDAWTPAHGGALRFLEGPDLDGPGGEAIPARYGSFAAFARADDSWHGHKPFAGERRVVQVFWLKDADAAARKAKRHKNTSLLKALWPF